MHEPHASTPATRGFEASEPRTRFIAAFGLSTIVALVAIILGLEWYVDKAKEEQIFVKTLQPVSEDLSLLRAREDGELHSYHYDRVKGTVRLPIDRAMELLSREYAAGKLEYPARPVPVQAPSAWDQDLSSQEAGGDANAQPAAD